MARFCFVVIPEKGHIHPMLGPAGHLRDRGHEVIFHAVLTRRVTNGGFQFRGSQWQHELQLGFCLKHTSRRAHHGARQS